MERFIYLLTIRRTTFGERKRKSERYSFGILFTGYLLSIVKIKKERERKELERERNS